MKILEAISRIDNSLSRATYPLMKRIFATRGVEIYKVESLGEQLVVNKNVDAMLTDAVNIQIAEGDLSEGLLSEREWHPDSRIRVKKIPRGEAPKEVRQKWVGVEMDAFRLPASLESVERGLVSGERIQPRSVDLYAVKLDDALHALGQKSPQAAKWFQTNLSSETTSLSFGANEVKVIRRIAQP